MTLTRAFRSDGESWRTRPRLASLLVPIVVASGTLVGLAAGYLATTTRPATALLLPLFAMPLLLWWRPRVGILLILGACVTIEQFNYTVGNRDGAVTAKIPFFHSVTPGSGVTPVEMLLFVILLIWLLQAVRDRRTLVPRSPVSVSIGVLISLVIVYFVVGVGRHGVFKIAMWEIRPWFYLLLMYLLAATYLDTEQAFRRLLWIFVIGSGAKAVYGLVIWWSVRQERPRPEAVLGHEESFFFGIFILLTLGLWLFGIPGRLRRVSTGLAPVVLLADMGNSRRTAWAIIGYCLVALMVVAYARLRGRRKVLVRVGAVLLVVCAIYLPAYWNKDGTMAQPARAVRSVISPDARDKESNQYRYIEDANLVLNIRMSKDLGTGFGRPIDYAIPIVDLSSENSVISYIPHNGVFYVWMRMGLLGELALWSVIGTALLRACQLTRVATGETRLLGALAVCAIIAYVLMGYEDMGFFWFRIAFCVGGILGAVEARLRSLTPASELGASGVGQQQQTVPASGSSFA